MAEYKMKSQRRKRESYAPYRTKKKEPPRQRQQEGLASRVWSWFTPSSWWQTREPSPSPSPPSSPTLEHEDTSREMTSEPQKPLLLTGDREHQKEEEEGGREGVVVNGLDNESVSWVAEDTPDPVTSQQTQEEVEYSVKRERNPAFPRPSSHSSSPAMFRPQMKSRLSTGSLLRSRPLLTSTPQLSPVNEADERGHPRHDDETDYARHATQPVVHQQQPAPRLQSIPETSSFSSTAPDSQLISDTRKHHRNYTDLSLSRSPFQSPFYSGRTSFGGAASGQRLRSVKRARRASSPPVLAPVQVTVRAKPHPLAPPTSSRAGPAPLLSSTAAQRILQTLDSLSSPLVEARKLPLRTPIASQPARKRHKSAHAALSPPPISSLSTPSLLPHTPSGPVLVPNEKSLRTTTTTNIAPSNSRESSLLGATLRPGNFERGQSLLSRQAGRQMPATSSISSQSSPPSLRLSSSSLLFPTSSVTAKSSTLASLKFSAPPPPPPPPPPSSSSQSPDHSKIQATPPNPGTGSRLNFSPKFHAANWSPLATSGGKMKSQHTRTHFSYCYDDGDEGGAPVAMVPPVGLQTDKPLSFPFAQNLMPPATDTTAAVVSMKTTVKSQPNFSFSTPKPVTSSTDTPTNTSLKPTSGPGSTPGFQFSAPTPAATPSLPLATPTQSKTTPTEAQAPPLKRESVVDILKRADYQALTNPSNKTERKSVSTAPITVPKPSPLPPTTAQPSLTPSPSLTVTNNSSAAKTSSSSLLTSTPSSSSPLPPLSMSTSGWECDACLVHNPTSALSCVACGAARPVVNQSAKPAAKQAQSLFAPPVGSWECPDCMLMNKQTDSKCVACGARQLRGGRQETGADKTTSQGGLQLGSGGGLKLGSASCGLQLGSLSGGLQLGSSGGLKLGSSSGAQAPPTNEPLKLLAQFAPPADSWSCDTCLVDNKSTDTSCVACGTAKPGSSRQQAPPTSTAAGSASEGGFKLGGGGLTFGAEGGLKLGGSGGGLKLCEGSVKLGEGGLNFGGLKPVGSSEGGLKIGEGGLKLGGGLKFGDGGVKFGGEGSQVTPLMMTSTSSSVEQPSGSGCGSSVTATTAKPLVAFAGTTEITKPLVAFAGTTETTKPLVAFTGTTEITKPLVAFAGTTETTKPKATETTAQLGGHTPLSFSFSAGTGQLPSSSQPLAGLAFPGSSQGSLPPPASGSGLQSAHPLPPSSSAETGQTGLFLFGSSNTTAGQTSQTGSLYAAATGQTHGFSFGATAPTAPSVSLGQTSQSSLTSSIPSFAFGQSNQISTSSIAPSFAFGQQTSQSSLTSSTPSFNSGLSKNGLTGSTPTFAFGQSNTQTSQSGSTSLTFGQSTQPTSQSILTGSAPSFVFGQSSLTGSTAPSFAFGQQISQQSSLTSSVTFGQSNTHATSQSGFTGSTPGFVFGQSSTQTSQSGLTGSTPSFVFGQQTSQSGPSAQLAFGQSNTQQPTAQTSLTGSAPSFVFGQQTSQQTLFQAPPTNQSLFTTGVATDAVQGRNARIIKKARRRK